ncbi:MAG: zf-HC2 domain-containing protein [Acidobacteriia bacterium]|nr:zf-HC2 domain-containing protein [Terriglobia bacterium]
MTEVPKIVPRIVQDRLRAAGLERVVPEQTASEPVHPDADVLTAFAEQALSATERDGVLEHLAHCGDCRELIALALPPVEIGDAPVAVETDAERATGARAGAPAPHKLSFAWPALAWPTLRWAALAAGVAVAAAVLLVHPGKLNQAVLPPESRQVNGGPQASSPQIAASPAASPSVATPSTNQLAVSTKAEEPQPKPEVRPSRKLKAPAMSPGPTEPGMLLADNKKDSGQADKPSAALSAGARAFDRDALAGRGATESVEVSGATVGVETESSALKVMAQNEAPVVKAKPAPQGIGGNGLQKAEVSAGPGTAMLQARNVMSAAKLTSSAGPALTNHVTWAITAGVLQRSLDSGQSWQEALRADRPLLCYASRDEEVWTGGQAGTLFRSADSGVTWLRVQPAVNTKSLSSDLIHIDLRGPAEVVISTSNQEIWSSADRGKTWEKK